MSSFRASNPPKSYFQPGSSSSQQPDGSALRKNTISQEPRLLPEQTPQVIVIKENQGGQSDAKKSVWLPRLGLIGLGGLLTLVAAGTLNSLDEEDDVEDDVVDDASEEERSVLLGRRRRRPWTKTALLEERMALIEDFMHVAAIAETFAGALLRSHVFMVEGLADLHGAVQIAIPASHPIELQDGTVVPASAVAAVKVLDAAGRLRSVLVGVDFSYRPNHKRGGTLDDDLADFYDWTDELVDRLQQEGSNFADWFYVVRYTSESVSLGAWGSDRTDSQRYDSSQLPEGWPLKQLQRVKSA